MGHDDVIKWKHFPRYWPFVRGIHRSPVNSPHKGQGRVALMFSLICDRINSWVNNREAGDLRRYLTHYDVTVMVVITCHCPRYLLPARKSSYTHDFQLNQCYLHYWTRLLIDWQDNRQSIRRHENIHPQSSNISRTLVGNKIVDDSNYIFILDLTHGYHGLGIGNSKTRRETFMFWDLMRLILQVWR